MQLLHALQQMLHAVLESIRSLRVTSAITAARDIIDRSTGAD